MKKHLPLLAILLLISFSSNAQIFTEDFDDNTGSTIIYTNGPCNDGSGDFFDILTLDGAGCATNAASNYCVTGGDGGSVLAAQDTDAGEPGCGTSDNVAATIDNVDISGCANTLYLCFDIAEDNANDGNEDWDGNSSVVVSVDIDNSGTFANLITFEANIPQDGSNAEPRVDTDCDGVGDGTEVTAAFQTFCVEITGTGSALDIQFAINNLDAGEEDVAIDNIRVYCETDPGVLPAIPTPVCSICSVPGTSANAQQTTTMTTGATASNGFDVDTQDDAWVASEQNDCPPGTVFEPIYGAIEWNSSRGEGRIQNLIQTDGNPYPGSVTFDVYEVIQECKGTGEVSLAVPTHNPQTGTSSDGSTMQGDSPKPSAIGDHFSENDAGGGNNMICIDLDVPVDMISFWIGDVESSNVNPGYIHVYDSAGDLIDTDPIPTVTPSGSQATECTGSTGTTGNDACGNDETVFVEVEASSSVISRVCIEVGDFPDDDSNPGATEHISFGGVSLGGECLLAAPVELLAFTASPKGDDVALDWATASEEDNAYFEVQWSLDGRTFETIGIVEGHGNSTALINYSYVHETPARGINYYRLKQNDFDGDFELSAIVVVDMGGEQSDQITIYPNPAKEELTISRPAEAASILIFDINKTLLQSFENADPNTTINLDAYPAGTYLIVIQTSTNFYTQRFVKL